MDDPDKNSNEDDEQEASPLLFVRIQSIDLQSLAIQTSIGNTSKLRHLTCMEASNVFLFMGSTSGTVYVFSRDTLKFLFIIPFKGGKICSIACSQDESDIAVGSIRGKVSIYRISPNVHYLQSSASMGDAFRDIYDVPHHTGAEITELQWSRNGKYVFTGDSHGIVSQTDVACLDEFPRPVPSKVILKLQSRILQIDCSFPYLAVSTLLAVFLCDLEKEDFTRIQTVRGTDIRSTGLTFMIVPEKSSPRDLVKEQAIPSATQVLFIGEAGTGTIHTCNMGGHIHHSRRVVVSSKVPKCSMPLFDPTKAVTIRCEHDNQEEEIVDKDSEPVSISLGKMLCTDDGMIVSASSDRINLYDPYTLNVITWNENFKRINNCKIISNYAFIWAGNKMEVIALSSFRSYAEQLFRAKLFNVLKNLILHTVYSLGWRESTPLPGSEDITAETDSTTVDIESTQSGDDATVGPSDKSKEKVVRNFKRMMCSEGDEESDFSQFIAQHVPFSISSDKTRQETGQHEELPNPTSINEEQAEADAMQPMMTFNEIESTFATIVLPEPLSNNGSDFITSDQNDSNRIALIVSQMHKKSEQRDSLQMLLQVWKSLIGFYEDLAVTLPQLDYKKSELTLTHILHASEAFLTQPKLVNIHEKIELVVQGSRFEDIVVKIISCLYPYQTFKTLDQSSNNFSLCFSKLICCPLVIQWFREVGTSQESLIYDGFLADMLLLLFPLVRHNRDGAILSSCLQAIGVYDKLPNYFMTWLFLCRFLHKPKPVPFSPLLRSLLNDQLFDKLVVEMFSTIYRDFRLSGCGNAAQFLHHALTTIVLLSKSVASTSFEQQQLDASLLLACFPLKKWTSEDIGRKIIEACHLNPALLGLFLKACLEDGHSMKLCACGIQAEYGSLDNKIPSWQRAIESAIIKLLLEQYWKSSNHENDHSKLKILHGIDNETNYRRAEMLVHMFAMRRGLIEPYFQSPLPDEFLSADVQAELIVRSGSCASLKHYPCNAQTMKILLATYQRHFMRSLEETRNGLCSNNGGSFDSSSVIFNTKALPDKFNNDNKLKCFKCSYPLTDLNNFTPMSRDCFGLWAFKQLYDLETLSTVIRDGHLDKPGIFSARFYKMVVRLTAKTEEGEHPFVLGDVSKENCRGPQYFLTCDDFHHE